MSKKAVVPDAWDDDWETLADKQGRFDQISEQTTTGKTSKAERRAKHAELNKQIWESAENPDQMLFLQSRESVPFQASFKPNVTVLSRKPPRQVLSKNSVASSVEGLTLNDDNDDDDSEEERRKKNEESLAERQARAAREREEKERRYAEVREKIFGSSHSPSDESAGRASPNRPSRGKGRSRGGRDSQPTSSADQSPARTGNQRKQLYDPGYSAKPNSPYILKKECGDSRPTIPNETQPIREPRGPHAIGRGGHGFAARRGRNGPAA